MKRIAALCFFCLAAGDARSAPESKPSDPPQATLHWENGETLSGELAEASDADLSWKSRLFQDPLVLRWSAVRRFEWPLAAVPSTDPFDLTLRDGSHLHGDLIRIDADTVSIQSTRHGDAVLERAEVLAIRRAHGGGLLSAGPNGDVGWVGASSKKEEARQPEAASETLPVPSLALAPGGALSMPYWNTGASLDIVLPEIVDIEFRVHSSASPDFQLSATAAKSDKSAKKPLLAVETWGEDLVLTADDDFKLIRKIPEGEKDVGLRLCWNRKERNCSVFAETGELLAEWQLPAGTDASSGGLALRNKGRDLSLELLRVRPWNGRAPAKRNPLQPRVELTDGSVVEGQVSAGSNDSITVRVEGEDSKRDIPMAKIDAIVFSRDPIRPSTHEVTLSYADGTLLMGHVDWLKNGRIALTTSFASEPLVSTVDGLRQLLLDHIPTTGPERPLTGLDQLVVQKTTLHGALVCDGGPAPRWLAVGGVKPVTLSKELPFEITRAFPPDAEVPVAPALFYTAAGDVLSGNLLALDRSGAEIESGIVEKKKLPAEGLDAIQFGTGVQSDVLGFGDPGWRILKGDKETVRQAGDSLDMDQETSFGHPAVMRCSEIKFKMPYTGFCFIRLRMFCSGTDGTRSTNLILGFPRRNAFFSGLQSEEGRFSNQGQTPFPTDEPVGVCLVIKERHLELHLNGTLVRTFPIDPDKRAGAGLIIEPAGPIGDGLQPISLNGFSARTSPGYTWTPKLNEEVMSETLTVPRSRREMPPRHALLGANDDVLRGEIEAATLTHFRFLTGLESVHIPRDRVKAVLWLKKPQTDPPAADKHRPALEILNQPVQMSAQMKNATLSSVIGALQGQTENLKFKLPGKVPTRTFQMQFSGQTVGEALDQICSLAGLSYHVDQAGVIVFEAVAKTADLVENSYWLKAASFPDARAVAEVLEAKGIPFPAGSAARWKPETGQLVVANTAENQRKLAKLLETEFGGISAAPTHWLLLSNGARIALTVDQFTAGLVSGRHPLYGRCNIPTSQVYIIRNTALEPSAAMRSLGNWRLAFAPEPVVSGTGADASADLGKEAKAFKLRLLEGGDFELAKEKGKVVVLDFWATWCGPCVKALPGLIEAMSAFPSDQVELIGVNQSEPAEQVRRFLETRGWKLTAALDAGQRVGLLYGVDSIPHTVIVGPDGKIAWVKTGYSAHGDAETAEAVKKLLAPSNPATPKTP